MQLHTAKIGPTFTRYPIAWPFQAHVPMEARDNTERRSCVICWEHDGVWIEPMGTDEWGIHVRRHFEKGGRWACIDGGGKVYGEEKGL